MNRDEDNETRKRRPSAGERSHSELPTAPDSREASRVNRQKFRPVTTNPFPGPSVSSTPWTPPAPVRRGPTHPAWENPPTQYACPRLRGREDHPAIPTFWPLLIAAIGVALVLGILVVYPALTGHGGNAAVASRSATATLSDSGSPSPTKVASPTQLKSQAPGPSVTYTKYKVNPGDTLSKLQKKFGLQRWEILVANPQITNPNVLKVGSILNIPKPGQLTQPPASPTATPAAS